MRFITLIGLLGICVSCTTQPPHILLYRSSNFNDKALFSSSQDKNEILYLYPFIALYRELYVSDGSTHESFALVRASREDCASRGSYYTEDVWNIKKSREYLKSQTDQGLLPDSSDHLIEGIKNIGWNYTKGVLYGSFIFPERDDGIRYFILGIDRLTMLRTKEEFHYYLNDDWGIPSPRIQPVAIAFVNWKQYADSRQQKNELDEK